MKGVVKAKIRRHSGLADQYMVVESLGQERRWPETLPLLREIIDEDDREIQAYSWLRNCSRKVGVSAVEESEKFISAKINQVEDRANAEMISGQYHAAIHDYTLASYLLPKSRDLPLPSLKIVACWLASQQRGFSRERECASLISCATETDPQVVSARVKAAIASFSSGMFLVHSMLSSGSTHVSDLLRASLDDTLVVMTPHAINRLYVGKPFLSGQSLLAGFMRENFFDKLRIVTMVRAPMDFLFSAYFFKRSPNTKKPAAVDEFLSDYVEKFVPSYLARGCWFDEQMRSMFGIDVFVDPYTESPGGRVYRNGKLLVLRVEDLNSLGADACLSPFVGAAALKDVGNRRANSTNPGYVYLKNSFKMSREMAKTICDMAYFREFYASDEVGMHLRKWT